MKLFPVVFAPIKLQNKLSKQSLLWTHALQHTQLPSCSQKPSSLVINSFGVLENGPMLPWFYSQKILRFLYLSVFFLPFIFTYFSHVYWSNPQHHQPSCLLSSFILSILPSLLYFQFISNSVSLCLSFYFSPLPSLIISLPLFPFNKCQAPRHPCEVENTLTTKVDTVSILSGLRVSCLFTETDIEKHCNCGEV